MVQAEDPDCGGKAFLSATCGVDFGCQGVEGGAFSAAMARKASQNSGSSETLVRWPWRVRECLAGRVVIG
jgi:hypothetical protein